MSSPIESLWAWVVDDPTGKHGIIAVMHPVDGYLMQAVSSKKHLMQKPHVIEAVEDAKKVTGLPVKLKRFALVEVDGE